jgi:hypothetical protein
VYQEGRVTAEVLTLLVNIPPKPQSKQAFHQNLGSLEGLRSDFELRLATCVRRCGHVSTVTHFNFTVRIFGALETVTQGSTTRHNEAFHNFHMSPNISGRQNQWRRDEKGV